VGDVAGAVAADAPSPGPPGPLGFGVLAGFEFMRAFHHKGLSAVYYFPGNRYVLYKT